MRGWIGPGLLDYGYLILIGLIAHEPPGLAPPVSRSAPCCAGAPGTRTPAWIPAIAPVPPIPTRQTAPTRKRTAQALTRGHAAGIALVGIVLLITATMVFKPALALEHAQVRPDRWSRMAVPVARIYDDPQGHRVLIDRLWPRGVKKEAAPWDDWWKDLAPSDGLRKAYHAGELDHEAFAGAYREELSEKERPDVPPDTVLVTAVKDVERSHAPVLAAWLDDADA